MNKKLLLITFILFYSISTIIYAQTEQDILDKHKDEFLARTLSPSNRKAVKGVNELGEKVIFITYDQVQTSGSNDNIKELVLTSKNNKITEVTFNYGSLVFLDGDDYMAHPKWDKGKALFQLNSKNILDENYKTVYLQNKYEVIVINTYDKKVFDIHLEAYLDISAAVCENIDLITEKYNEAYKTRTLEELKVLGLLVVDFKNGYEETNLVLMKMILKEREAIINNILRDYNSSFKIELHSFVSDPDQVWDEFYIDPIKFITTFCDNSPLLE